MEYSKPTLAPIQYGTLSRTHTLHILRKRVDFERYPPLCGISSSSSSSKHTDSNDEEEDDDGEDDRVPFYCCRSVILLLLLGLCCDSTSTIDTRMMVPILYTFVGGAKSVT